MANISVTVQDGNNITLISTPTATQVITIDRGIAGPAGPVGPTASPGGSNTQIQYNSAGVFAGSANLTFNGTTLTTVNGASIQGLTVGRGGGAIAGNTALGFTAGASNTGGEALTAIGAYAAFRQTGGSATGDGNTAIGVQASYSNISGNENTAVGQNSLLNNLGTLNTAIGASSGSGLTTGNYNTFVGGSNGNSISNGSYNVIVGYFAGRATTGDKNVMLGHGAGTYETGSDSFYVDNQNRANTAGDKAGALLYGTFNTTPSSQTLKVNAALTATYGVTLSAGTANGVAYLNGSKVLTTGSALTFDGTNLGLGGTPNSYGSTTTFTVTGSSYSEIDFKAGGTLQGHIAGGASSFEIGTDGAFPLLFKINGSEAMRLTSTGLGIGTSSPTTKLHIANAGPAFLRVNNASSTVDLYVGAQGGDATVAVVSNHPLSFATNSTERARIDTSGNLLVGTTSAFSGGVTISGAGVVQAERNDISLVLNRTSSDGGVAAFRRGGTPVGSIDVTTTTTSYVTSSDYRLKNITGPITTSGAYIDSLKPVEGTWKADGSTFVGLIAHETQEASRTTVATGTKDGDEMQGMDYSSAEIIANLIAELQSVRTRLAALEAK